MAARKESQRLLRAINEALADMEMDGTMSAPTERQMSAPTERQMSAPTERQMSAPTERQMSGN